MAQLDPTGGKSTQKKKSSATEQKRRAKKLRKPNAFAAKPVAESEAPAPKVGRLERTRRLLLAALRVWELKRRIRD